VEQKKSPLDCDPQPRGKVSVHAAWAMAVGGMIGGGIYTLAGVILGVAGPLAWLSLLLGSVLALITVRSYFRLTLEIEEEGVPVTFLLERGQTALAGALTWWLILVYVFAMAVYAFTFSHYMGRALGVSHQMIGLIVLLNVGSFVALNLRGIGHSARVQITAVWLGLFILAALACIGFIRWNPQNLVAGVPGGNFGGVFLGMAATFIAFEGFEMLAYDIRELRCPREVLGKALPLAVIAVAVAYSVVTLGAASLVGANVLVEQEENALAVAGEKAAGTTGFIIVTVAACASAASALNATLFSVARLASSAAERGLLPSICARRNRRNCPHWSVVILGIASSTLAATASLETLVQAASLAFLLLFCIVNTLAFFATEQRPVLPLVGGVTAAAAAVVVGRTLALAHPWTFGGFLAVTVVIAVLYGFRRSSGRRAARLRAAEHG
jgi:amino acid transporter